MILTSINFGAGCIKNSRDQKVKKSLCALCLSASLRENLWDGRVFSFEFRVFNLELEKADG